MVVPLLISDLPGLAAVPAEPSSVAILTVPWSVPERFARAELRELWDEVDSSEWREAVDELGRRLRA